MRQFFRKRPKMAGLVLATLLVSVSLNFFDLNTFLYQTSILSYPEHAPFDGTVYPIKKIPDWSALNEEERELPYSSLGADKLIDLPYYDPNVLAVSTDSLVWGDPADNAVRNAKITYSVPYLGSYALDGQEGSGSHPAVDIKVPGGTPIFAIANGTVTKASRQSSGFGYHAVLVHNNFPSLDDPNAKTTIHSSYSHLGELLVEVGDVVGKGDQIAISGESGTATTPHLHFQIDNEQAPWHPFWPFTWQEATDAGLDFFSAVNAGLGKENAILTTINPMKYVQAYLNESVTADSVDASDDDSSADNPVDDSAVTDGTTTVDDSGTVTDDANDSTDGSTDGTTPDGSDTTVTDPDVAINSLFSDLPDDSKYFEAVKFLVEKGVIGGYPDGTFRPEDPVNRVEALKFILESIKAQLVSGVPPFSDVAAAQWYNDYLYTGYEKAIVNGNPDGTFRPENPVNKAEFLKILFLGMSVDINPIVNEAPYKDVPVDAWFAPYFAYAKELGILDVQTQEIGPSAAMSRGEVAEAMYRLIKKL